MESLRTMSIGSITHDLFIPLPQDHIQGENLVLPLGHKHRISQVTETPGGGGANTAVSLSRLGQSAAVCGVVGCDQWGQYLVKELNREGVNTDSVPCIEDEISSFSIILREGSGRRIILNDAGTSSHFHDVTFDRDAASKVDWVMLSRISEEACVIQDDLIEIFTGSSIGLTWNPGGCQLDHGIEEANHKQLLKHTNILQLNKEEAMRFSRSTSLSEAMGKLVSLGPKLVCITDGQEGSFGSNGKETVHCRQSEPVDVIDATGAGDAFTSGVTWALMEGKSLPQALQAGTLNATSVLGQIGAQAGLLQRDEMEHTLQSSPPQVDTVSL